MNGKTIALAAFAVLLLPAQAGVAVRNPFTPIGTDGVREEISADYHLARAKRLAAEAAAREAEAKAAAEAAAKKKTEAEAKKVAESARQAEISRKAEAEKVDLSRPASDAEWSAAMKAIKFGGRIRASSADGVQRACVVLDGKTYSEGDLKSVDFGRRRFTWRVTGIDGASQRLRLVRVGDKAIETKGR